MTFIIIIMIIMNAMDEHIKSCFQNFGEFSAIFLNNMNQFLTIHLTVVSVIFWLPGSVCK